VKASELAQALTSMIAAHGDLEILSPNCTLYRRPLFGVEFVEADKPPRRSKKHKPGIADAPPRPARFVLLTELPSKGPRP